ncbi:MAG TPA: YbaK/EbsC family protein [Syntrophales bacterium]|nr:YbaK/EbsC family protein [Syntrophales bacterium]
MVTKDHFPATPAVRVLRDEKVDFILRPYKYEERGGTEVAARELGVDEHMTIKTLVMEDDLKRPFIILMHGDREVSTKELARILGVKAVHPCDPVMAQKHTGYMIGGTSPFGIRKSSLYTSKKPFLVVRRFSSMPGGRGFSRRWQRRTFSGSLRRGQSRLPDKLHCISNASSGSVGCTS